MKKLNILLLLGSGALFSCSVPANSSASASGLSASSASQPSSEPSIPAQSSATSQADEGFTLYVKVAAWWADDSARSGIYLWNNNDNAVINANWPGQAMESVNDSVWKFTVEDPSVYTHLIFTRISDKDPIADWGAKTIDLAIADINLASPLYDISGQTNPIWGDPGVSGNWVAIDS